MIVNREQWLEERRTGIGGTDIGALLGLSPWKTAREVWDEKVGLTPIDDTMRGDAEIGLFLEPLIRDKYEELTGNRVHIPSDDHPRFLGGCSRHEKYEWLIGSLDGYVAPVEGAALGVWEAKAPWSTTFWRIKREGLPEAWIVQLQWYLLVTGFSWGVWAILDRNSGDLLTFEIKADTQLQARLFEEGQKFWDCVKREEWDYDEPMKPTIEMPELSGDDKVLHIEPGDAEWRSLIAMRQEAKAMADEAGYVEDEAKKKIQTLMGDHTVAEVEGIARIYNRRLPGKLTLDKKMFGYVHPKIDLGRFTKQGKPYEYFRVYAFKE